MFKLSKKSLIFIVVAVFITVFSVSIYCFKTVLATTQPANSSQEINDLNSSITQKKKQLEQVYKIKSRLLIIV
jgi:cell division protein FtsL